MKAHNTPTVPAATEPVISARRYSILFKAQYAYSAQIRSMEKGKRYKLEIEKSTPKKEKQGWKKEKKLQRTKERRGGHDWVVYDKPSIDDDGKQRKRKKKSRKVRGKTKKMKPPRDESSSSEVSSSEGEPQWVESTSHITEKEIPPSSVPKRDDWMMTRLSPSSGSLVELTHRKKIDEDRKEDDIVCKVLCGCVVETISIGSFAMASWLPSCCVTWVSMTNCQS